MLLVPDAALVLLGFGRGMAASAARDREPRYAGRHVTLPARHPDELLAWTASADVALIPLPPLSMNQRCRRRTSSGKRSRPARRSSSSAGSK